MKGPNVFLISDCYKRPSRKKIIRDFGDKEKKNKARLILKQQMAQQRNEVIQIEGINLNWWGKNNIILKNN